jgi:hypothetical protein
VRRAPPFNDLVAELRGVAKEEGLLLEVAGAPLGLSLTKMSVFEQLEMPYFAHDYVPGDSKHDADSKIILYRDILPEKVDKKSMYTVTEDYYFCSKLRKKGFNVWVHLGLTESVGHIGYKTYYQEDGKEGDNFKA